MTSRAAWLGMVGMALLGACGRLARDDVQCGRGLAPREGRCCVPGNTVDRCSDGLVRAPRRVALPATTLLLGPSDWEAEGRVAPRQIHAGPFFLDADEATVAEVETSVRGVFTGHDGARAARGIAREDAVAYCTKRGGRLPTEDEWIAAASGARARRYPWGDTGAVCRRAAWGLATGPCATHDVGADTVGAHPDGDSPDGVHDLGGNVAEWVAASPADRPGVGVAHGGSWRTALASELRNWARLELDVAAHDDRVGVRCAYDAAAEP